MASKHPRTKRPEKSAPEAIVAPRPAAHWLKAVPAVLLVVASLAAYINSFRGTFVFDDRMWIARNPEISGIWPSFGMLAGIRPVASYTFAVNYAIHGLNAWGYHAANFAIHCAAGLLLFGLIRGTLARGSLAARYGAAAVPLCSSSPWCGSSIHFKHRL